MVLKLENGERSQVMIARPDYTRLRRECLSGDTILIKLRLYIHRFGNNPQTYYQQQNLVAEYDVSKFEMKISNATHLLPKFGLYSNSLRLPPPLVKVLDLTLFVIANEEIIETFLEVEGRIDGTLYFNSFAAYVQPIDYGPAKIRPKMCHYYGVDAYDVS